MATSIFDLSNAEVLRIEDALLRFAPYRQFEYVTVVFPTAANTDLDIAHRLRPPDPENIVYHVMQASGPPMVYHDTTSTRTPWSSGIVRLRSSIGGLKARILLAVPTKSNVFDDGAVEGGEAGTGISEHNLLSATHLDTTAAAAQVGDLVIGARSGSTDGSKFWADGLTLDGIATARDFGELKYFADGLSGKPLMALDAVRWIRKGIGTAGTVWMSNGLTADWAELPPDAVPPAGSQGASVYRAGDFTLGDDTDTLVSFTTETFDDDDLWDSGSPTRLTVPSGKDGKYLALGQITFDSALNARIFISLFLNGSEISRTATESSNMAPPDVETYQATKVLNLIVGDYLELNVRMVHNTPGTTHAVKGGEAKTFLQLVTL